jgi:hypothetical protein
MVGLVVRGVNMGVEVGVGVRGIRRGARMGSWDLVKGVLRDPVVGNAIRGFTRPFRREAAAAAAAVVVVGQMQTLHVERLGRGRPVNLRMVVVRARLRHRRAGKREFDDNNDSGHLGHWLVYWPFSWLRFTFFSRSFFFLHMPLDYVRTSLNRPE